MTYVRVRLLERAAFIDALLVVCWSRDVCAKSVMFKSVNKMRERGSLLAYLS
jgi:hypothetical protein